MCQSQHAWSCLCHLPPNQCPPLSFLFCLNWLKLWVFSFSFHICWSQRLTNLFKVFLIHSSLTPGYCYHFTDPAWQVYPAWSLCIWCPVLKPDQPFVWLDIWSSFSQKPSLTHPYHQLQGKVQTMFWMKLTFLVSFLTSLYTRAPWGL